MATLAARAVRGAQSRDELTAELAELGKRLDVVMPESPARSADPELQPILETEWQRDFVRAVNAALGGGSPPPPDTIPAPVSDDDPETASESSQSQSRRQRGRNQ